MWQFKRDIMKVVEETPSVPTTLTITSSIPTESGGTVDFTGGQSGEVLQLDFDLYYYDEINFQTLEFDSPIAVLILDPLHTMRNGSVTLDEYGNASSVYSYMQSGAAFNCSVKISSRSSAETMPVTDTTYISNT